MAFNFRKSFKLLPGVRLNLSKKGMGVSFGGKGFRHSIGASGRRTTTVGIPGTGLSYSKTSTKSKSKRKTSSTPRARNTVNNMEGSTMQNGKVKKPFYKQTWFIVTCVILGIGIIANIVNPPDRSAEPVDSPASIAASESVPSSSGADIERGESTLSSSTASLPPESSKPPIVESSQESEPPESSAPPVSESSQESEPPVSSEVSEVDVSESSVSEPLESSTPPVDESSVASEPPPESAPAEEAPADQEIVVNGSLDFSRNENATVSIVGIPNTQYSIAVYYSSGKSTAAGLEPKTSDASGNVSWTWKIGGKTNPGTYRATITGGGETKEIAFTVS